MVRLGDIQNPLISQSEADSFLSCERKHYYAFGEKLQPIKYGAGLSRGIMGHEVLGAYYEPLMSGNSLESAERIAMATLNDFIVHDSSTQTVELVVELQILLGAYFSDPQRLEDMRKYEILSVEQIFHVEFDRYTFPFKPDMIWREKDTGKVFVVDHKFLYNFYKDTDTAIMPQLPKYMGGLMVLGLPVDGVMYNMLRHRKNALEKFMRISYKPPTERIQSYLHEQETVANHIQIFKGMELERWEKYVVRTASSYNCKNCSFLDLCQTDLDKRPGRSILVNTFYEKNTYGYDVVEMELNVE